MGNNFGRIDAKRHRSKVFNVEKINNLSILYGTATFSAVFSLIMDVKSDTLPSLKHIAKTILRGCKGQKICYNSDIYHHNYNGEFMKKLFGFTRSENAAHVDTSNKKRKAAFTLAEVLITLGIIGVVAAMTMPVLIYNHKKSVTETAAKKFYSNMNQAVLRAEIDFGDKLLWNISGTSLYDTYLKNYLLVTQTKYVAGARPSVELYFSDGSYAKITSRDISYCVKASYYERWKESNLSETGQCLIFAFYPNGGFADDCLQKNYYKKGVVPYLNEGRGLNCEKINNNDIEYMCDQHLYTKVLEQNGWRFPKNCKVEF